MLYLIKTKAEKSKKPLSFLPIHDKIYKKLVSNIIVKVKNENKQCKHRFKSIYLHRNLPKSPVSTYMDYCVLKCSLD